MMSVFTQMKLLEAQKVVEIQAIARRHFYPGEGAFFYQGQPTELRSDYLGPRGPKDPNITFEQPHDLIWEPKSGTILASAPSDLGAAPGQDEAEESK